MIAVILPVYNVEKYVGRCIESILNQTYKQFELIIVDDGSTDNSLAICKHYQEQYPKIYLFHKENGGISSARNFGLEIAKKHFAEYVTFIDSDDYVSEFYLEELMNGVLKYNCDISICNSKRTTGDNCLFKKSSKVKFFSKANALEDIFYQRTLNTAPRGKLYKTSCFDNLEFPVGYIFEDLLTIYKTFLKSNKVCYFYSEDYAYRVRDNSIMAHRNLANKIVDFLNVEESLSKINISEKVNKAIASRRFVNALDCLVFINTEDENFEKLYLIAKNLCKNVIFSKSLLKIKIYALIVFFLNKDNALKLIKKIKGINI